jgi:beta-galactosidase
VVQDGKFLLDGAPYQILSGEMHYPRIPREYWRDRLKKARAMGLNTISTYVFWNLHEPEPGVYDFSGNLDVAAFIRTAQQEGLHVILRPGPYVCAEWDLGAYPAWLLADPKMAVRSNDDRFMAPAEHWMMRLGQELAPLQIDRGGPVLAVQLENEYGSFGDDQVYLAHWRDILRRAGFTAAVMYTADGPDLLKRGNLPGVLAVANFGPGDAQGAFRELAKYEPGQPLMCGEYWAGWFDHWGQRHVVQDHAAELREYEWMLSHGYSVNIYVFHGGTTFGFMNGANIDNSNYESDVTSYDYDAALDESGRTTKLYFALHDIIARQHPERGIPPLPQSPATITIAPFALEEKASLWESLPTPASTDKPLTMEELGQSYGYLLYRTHVAGPIHGDLVLAHLEDYAQVYLDGKFIGSIDRRLHQDRLSLGVQESHAQIDILVENSGRVNYGPGIRDERKGIGTETTFAGRPLTNWQMYALPMSNFSRIRFRKVNSGETQQEEPSFYRAKFRVETPGDTFLDVRTLAKGAVWLNGHPLGRFWNIGPQRTLYVPGPWLKKGWNELIVFDLRGRPGLKLSGLAAPILDGEVAKE